MNRFLLCLAMLVPGLLPAVSQAIEFRAIHGASNNDLQKWYNESAEAGYRVTYLQGFRTSDGLIFAAVAIKDGRNLQYEARFNVSDEALKRFTQEFSQMGYRVSCVSGFADGDTTRYSAIWTKGEKQGPWQAANKASSADYQALFNHFAKDQLMPTFLAGYADSAGKTKLAALFEKQTDEPWIAQHDLSSADYQKVVTDQSAKGLRPITLTVYPGTDGPLFAVVMRKDGVAWAARHGLTSEQYQQQFNQQAEKGLRPLCISAYDDGGELRYAAVWIKDPEAQAPAEGPQGPPKPDKVEGVTR